MKHFCAKPSGYNTNPNKGQSKHTHNTGKLLLYMWKMICWALMLMTALPSYWNPRLSTDYVIHEMS